MVKTIQILNSGSVVPDEILICIPEGYEKNVSDIYHSNIKILITKVKGQVAQRAEGFKLVSCRYVLQLDDDIIVDYQCLENLVKVLESNNEKIAVSPALRFISNDNSVYDHWRNKSLRIVYFFVINGQQGYKPGSITKAGTEIGVNPGIHDVIEVDWLPGGCILHSRENLELSNFYPHPGKAYSEDLYHSLCLKNKDIKLFVAGNALAWIEDSRLEKMDIYTWLRGISNDYSARRYYVKMVPGSSMVRMNFHYVLLVSKNLSMFLVRKCKGLIKP